MLYFICRDSTKENIQQRISEMVKRNYAIVGASGQIGRALSEHLLKRGHGVKAIGRNASKLASLKAEGAEVIICKNFAESELFEKIFPECDALFVMLPPGYDQSDLLAYQDRVGEALVKGLRRCAHGSVVNLSTIGAQFPSGGPLTGLHRQEERLNQLNQLHILHLRPGYFMENLFRMIPSILQTGKFHSPIKPHIALPMVATPDIAMRAAEILDQCDFKGDTIYELVGPRPVTLQEAAPILGQAIGKPNLSYELQSIEEARKEMIEWGIPPKVAADLLEMYEAINKGYFLPTQKLTPNQHGTITLEEFAKIFAKEYKSEAEKMRIPI